jgi:hypothetical protein
MQSGCHSNSAQLPLFRHVCGSVDVPLSNVLRTKWKIFSSFVCGKRIVQGSSPQRAALNGYDDFKNTMPRGIRPEPFLPLPRPASTQRLGTIGLEARRSWNCPGCQFSAGCPFDRIAGSRLRQADTFQEEPNARLPVSNAEPGSMWPVDSFGMPRLRNPAYPAPIQSRAGGKNDGGAGLRVEGSGRQLSGFERIMPILMHFFSVFHRRHRAAARGREPDQAPVIHPFLLRRQFRSAYSHLLLT